MPIELKITAADLHDLWSQLSVFTRTTELAALAVADVVEPEAPAPSTETVKTGKRGRPPKVTPASAATMPSNPDPGEPEDDPSSTPVEEGEVPNGKDQRQQLIDQITMHWVSKDPVKRERINQFKKTAGLAMLADLKPGNFDATRALIRELDAMV